MFDSLSKRFHFCVELKNDIFKHTIDEDDFGLVFFDFIYFLHEKKESE